MLRWMFRLILSVAMVTACSSAVVAECAAPANSGLAMCFPSVGSTVLYPATIELAANSGGVAITDVSVYDGNVQIDNLGFIPGKLVDFALKNGFHRLTVNAWDANGKLYQAKSSFTITGFGVGACAASGAVALCSPAQGSYQPESSVPIAATFAAGVKSWSIALDGQALMNSAQFGQPTLNPLYTSAPAAAGSHTMVVSAVDAQGVTNKVTRLFSTFYDGSCNPKSGTCAPGITITQPTDIGMDTAGDESTSFRLQAEVSYNPKPTTKMIVYLDGTKVQQSTGPGITANVTAAKGSHYLVIQAWDTTGRMYETYGNVNLQ
jgi:hypothetical protein